MRKALVKNIDILKTQCFFYFKFKIVFPIYYIGYSIKSTSESEKTLYIY